MSNWKPADDGRSYADKGDSATSFNPDERFEADRAAEKRRQRPDVDQPDYPSREAMMSAVELEIHAALGQVQTVVIGQLIQKAVIASRIEAQRACAEAYVVVGSLLSDLGQFDTNRGQHILDNLSGARIVHADVLPWPSFERPAAPAAQVCGACGQVWTGEKCGQADNGWQHEVCYPVPAAEPEAQSSADSAQPVAWRWRSIFNDSSWCYGPVMPTAHDQYVTEPLYVRTEPQASADRDGFDKEDFADDGAYLARFSTAPTVPQTVGGTVITSADWQNAKVSIDVSTGDDDAGHRVFGRVIDWQPQDWIGDKGVGLNLLCEYESDNFGMRSQAVSAQHRYDQDGQTCPTCGRVGNGEG
jgi:hypothetical protein